MKNVHKKLLCILLTAMLLFSFVPSAIAADEIKISAFWDLIDYYSNHATTELDLFNGLFSYKDNTASGGGGGVSRGDGAGSDWYSSATGQLKTDTGTTQLDGTGQWRYYFTWRAVATISGIEIASYSTYQPAVTLRTSLVSGTRFFSSDFSVPVTGNYTLVWPGIESCPYDYKPNNSNVVYIDKSDGTGNFKQLHGAIYASSSYPLPFSPGVLYYISFAPNLVAPIDGNLFFTMSFYPPYLLMPDNPIPPSDTSGSRVGSIVGDFAYYGDGGHLTAAENIQIVNETDNSVYNPVTGDTYNVIDWVYDYSTRSYSIVTDNSQNIVVTYGDENITIIEGDTTYNVYYVIPDSPSEPEPTPTPNPGGGGSGDNGNNNDDDDSPSIWDSIWDKVTDFFGKIIDGVFDLIATFIEKILDFFIRIFDKVLEGLNSFVNLIMSAFLELPELFSGFTEFLSAVFPYMPPEFGTVIIFGIVAIIAAAIIKRFLG